MSYQCLACNEFSDDVIGADTSYEICYDCYGVDKNNNPELIDQIEQFLHDNNFINEIVDDDEGYCQCEEFICMCEECTNNDNMINDTNNINDEDMIDIELTINYDEYFDIDKYLDTYIDTEALDTNEGDVAMS